MAYYGAEAYRLDNFERAYERQATRPVFDVIEGGGADARVRQGVSEGFLVAAKVALVAVVAFVFAGVVRVGITTLTVNALSRNVDLERQIADFESVNSDMRIERSILSSSARIDRIAAQNLGMVLATEHDLLTLADVPPSGEAATSAGDVQDDSPYGAEESSQGAHTSDDLGLGESDAAKLGAAA